MIIPQNIRAKLSVEILRNASKLVSGNIIAQMIPLLVSPLITRLYTPDSFSTFGIFLAIQTVFGVFATGRFDLALIIPGEKKAAINLYNLALVCSLFLSIVLVPVLLIFRTGIAGLFGVPELSGFLFLLPPAIAFHGITLSMVGVANREKHYSLLAFSNIFRAVILNGSCVLFGVVNMQVEGLIYSLMAGIVAQLLFLGIRLYRKDPEYMKIPRRIEQMKATFREYLNFPLHSTRAALINVFSNQLPILTLNKLFEQASTGFYFHTFRILNSPVTVISGSIGQVYFQYVSNLRSNNQDISRSLIQLYVSLFLIAVLPISLITVYGDYIFAFVFGADWKQSGDIAMLISPWILFYFIARPITYLYELFNQQKLLARINTLMLVLRILAIAIGGFVFKSLNITVGIYAFVSFIIYFYICAYYLRKVGNSRYLAWKSLLLFIIMLAVLILIRILFV